MGKILVWTIAHGCASGVAYGAFGEVTGSPARCQALMPPAMVSAVKPAPLSAVPGTGGRVRAGGTGE